MDDDARGVSVDLTLERELPLESELFLVIMLATLLTKEKGIFSWGFVCSTGRRVFVLELARLSGRRQIVSSKKAVVQVAVSFDVVVVGDGEGPGMGLSTKGCQTYIHHL